jgi:aspartate aminotransferase
MNLSSKILGLNPSPTDALNAKAQQLEKQGAKVLNFAVGEPDFPTPKAIVDIAIQSLQNGKTKYGPAGGGLPFRQAIADKLNRDNHLSFDPSQVVCGIGAKELLFHIFLAMLNDGDEVILSAPCWVSYKDQIKAAGGLPNVIPMPESPSAPLIDVHTIDKYASDRTVAYVLCSPNNPAGYMVDPESLKKLAGYLSTKSWWIVSDEIYEYLAFDQPHQSILAIAPDLKGKTVIVNGMSK